MYSYCQDKNLKPPTSPPVPSRPAIRNRPRAKSITASPVATLPTKFHEKHEQHMDWYAQPACWCSVVARLLVDQVKTLGCPSLARSHLAALPPHVLSAYPQNRIRIDAPSATENLKPITCQCPPQGVRRPK